MNRCLKPGHFLIGNKNRGQNTIYLIGDPKTMQHIPCKEGKV